MAAHVAASASLLLSANMNWSEMRREYTGTTMLQSGSDQPGSQFATGSYSTTYVISCIQWPGTFCYGYHFWISVGADEFAHAGGAYLP
jgi:hypothetical protein